MRPPPLRARPSKRPDDDDVRAVEEASENAEEHEEVEAELQEAVRLRGLAAVLKN